MSRIYFVTDERNLVYPCCDYSENIKPRSGWITGELEGNAHNDDGVLLWKYENGSCVQRTPEEVQADIDALPLPEPTGQEILRADIDYLLMLAEEE